MRRKTFLLWKKLLTRFLSIAFVIGVLYVYFRTGIFTIHEYKIIGAPEGYVETLQTEFGYVSQHKLFWFLPSNRVISYHDDEMRTTIMETLPNTKSIRIYPSGLHVLTIKIDHHEPLFAVSDTYAISQEGTVYKEIVSLANFPLLTIASSTKVTPETLQMTSRFIANVHAVLFPVHFITIDEYNDIRLFNETKKSFIILSPTVDMGKQWSNILSAIDTDPLKGKLVTQASRLEYIDARFGNKIFYKFTTVEEPAIIPQSETIHATTTATTTLQ